MLTTLRAKSLFSTGPKFTEVEYRSPALILVCVCVPTGKLLHLTMLHICFGRRPEMIARPLIWRWLDRYDLANTAHSQHCTLSSSCWVGWISSLPL